MASVRFDAITKRFDDGTLAVRELDLEVADGELMVLVGPSGCGKTTALRIVAGLETATEGTLRIGDVAVGDLPPNERDIAMVFQNYALFPHLDVFANIAFGLRVRRTPKAEIAARVDEVARMVGLTDLLHRKPKALSGGQRQRVAMGRAIIRSPQVLLMDEPLSNLDAKLRGQMRAEISRVQRKVGTTTLYVTHDQVEAMTMGDRIAMLRHGELQQVGPPEQLYARPANTFVAGFLGSPSMNFLRASVERREDGSVCRIAGEHELRLAAAPREVAAGAEVIAGVRPEHVLVIAPERAGLRGRVSGIEALGAEVLVHVELPDGAMHVDAALRDDEAAGSVFIARLGGTTRPAIGDTVGLDVDSAQVLLFESTTGRALPRAGERDVVAA